MSAVPLMQMLGANYEKYSHFKTKVLEVAQKDLKTHTDICFEYIELKQVRKVFSIKFFIFQNDSKEEVNTIISMFKEKTNHALDYNRTAELIELKGLSVVVHYIENFDEFLKSTNVRYPANFFYDIVRNESPIPTKNKLHYNKPEQSYNFEQREYDDEYFDSLYDNFKD